jgi:hypothetical protein
MRHCDFFVSVVTDAGASEPSLAAGDILLASSSRIDCTMKATRTTLAATTALRAAHVVFPIIVVRVPGCKNNKGVVPFQNWLKEMKYVASGTIARAEANIVSWTSALHDLQHAVSISGQAYTSLLDAF